MTNRKIRIAITHGDTNGIGYELIFRTFSEPEMLELCTPIIYGSPKSATYHRNALGIQANFTIIKNASEAEDGRINMLATVDNEIKADLGTPTLESGEAALKALEQAVKDLQEGLFDVLVTAPMTIEKLSKDKFPFFSQTEYMAKQFGEGCIPLEIVTNRGLRMMSLTNNVPLSQVSERLNLDMVVSKMQGFAASLKRDFRASAPRIALLAFNSQDESGEFVGKEEREVLKPAIEKVNENSPIVFGPYTADSFFASRQQDVFDGIVTIYQEQLSLACSLTVSETPVCLVTGLPKVLTFANQDCNFSIAGKGLADETSFRDAIYLAIDVLRNREDYDRPFENPLPKLYHEKKDEGDKPRFVSKKTATEKTSEG